ncbi:MAG: mannose-6-phosphate isomerase, class I [Spirochaetaceae bacterium]|nr:MAG: mannose-6-phosphate isomerase, class I [Spirochaetaceae bacterium]
MALYRMINPVQPYAWGSTTKLAEIQRRAPGNTPQAELWMGSHPVAPSALLMGNGRERPLPEHLALHEGALGPRAALLGLPGDSAPDLPFLFKILAVERGLSIQVHPDRGQAAAGFEREEAARIPRTAPVRSYRDRNHKPELLCAITEFSGLCGFRPDRELVEEMRTFREFLRVQCALDPPAALISAIGRYLKRTGEETWRAVFLELLRTGENPDSRAGLVEQGAAYVAARLEGGLPEASIERYRRATTLLEQYPGDPGALAPLYLNLVHLRPGEALFLGPGILHAYLSGAAVEIMAGSDNVVRAGCTVKHVDGEELARIVRFERSRQEVLKPVMPGDRPGLRVYRSPAEEFELLHISRAGRFLKGEGPAIILNLGDPVDCSSGDRSLELPPGESLFADHETTFCDVHTQGQGTEVSLYVAALPGAIR